MKDKREICVKENVIYKGKILSLNADIVKTPNGNESLREIVHHRGGVAVLPIVKGKIVLVKQYRYAYDEELFEIPAGKLEEGENPKDAAIRELHEEVGLLDENIISLGEVYPTCGYSNEVIHLYLSKNAKQVNRHLDEDEFIDVYEFDKETVMKMIDEGNIKDAKTIIAIYKYFYKED